MYETDLAHKITDRPTLPQGELAGHVEGGKSNLAQRGHSPLARQGHNPAFYLLRLAQRQPV